jgi:membrane glycosyltransferase
MAEAKIADAETIEDAVQWLNRGERLVTLSDRALIGMIARLPHKADLTTSGDARAAE